MRQSTHYFFIFLLAMGTLGISPALYAIESPNNTTLPTKLVALGLEIATASNPEEEAVFIADNTSPFTHLAKELIRVNPSTTHPALCQLAKGNQKCAKNLVKKALEEAAAILENEHQLIADDTQLKDLVLCLENCKTLLVSHDTLSRAPRPPVEPGGTLPGTSGDKTEPDTLGGGILSLPDNVTINNDLTVNNNATINHNLAVNNNVTVGNSLSVTGSITSINGNVVVENHGAVQLNDATLAQSSVSLKAPGTGLVSSYTLTFPDSAGTNNYVLTTDGTGNLRWTSPGSVSGAFTNGGNDFGADATLGTDSSSNYGLNIETHGSPRVELSATGDVGITSPLVTLNQNNTYPGAPEAGLLIEGSSPSDSGYIKTVRSPNSIVLKAPGGTGTVTISPGASNITINQSVSTASSPTFTGVTLAGSTSGTVTLHAPATVTTYSNTWPSAVAVSNNSALVSDTSGNLSWFAVAPAGNYWVVGGNHLTSGSAILGTDTTSTQDLLFQTNAQTRMSIANTSGLITATGALYANGGIDVTSGTLNIATSTNASTINLGTSTASQDINIGTGNGGGTINIGTGTGTNTINIGAGSDTVNIGGTLTWVKTTDLQVTDKVITVNQDGAAGSGNGSGIQVYESPTPNAGYCMVGDSRASWLVKAPGNTGIVHITPAATDYTINQGVSTSDTPSFLGIKFEDTTTHTITVAAASTSATYALTLPATAPATASLVPITTNTSGTLGWITAGASNTASTLVERDSSGNFAAANVTVAEAILKGSTAGTITLQAPASVTSYSTIWPSAVAAANNSALVSDTSGNLSWLASTPNNTVSTLVERDSSGNFAAANVTVAEAILKGSTAGAITLQAPASVTSYSTIWPSAVAAANNSALVSDTSGNLSWLAVAPAGNYWIVGGNHLTSGSAALGTDTTSTQDLLLQTNSTTRLSIANSTGTIAIPAFTTAGIVHNAVTTGALSSSLIVDADITSGTIANNKMAAISSSSIANDIVVRDSSGDFAARNVTVSQLLLKDTTTHTITLDTAASSATYALTLPATAPATANLVPITTDTSGTLGWITTGATNTASTLVERDSSGNFAAGNITATQIILPDTTTPTAHNIVLQAPTTVTPANCTFTWPNNYAAGNGYALTSTTAGIMSWQPFASGSYWIVGGNAVTSGPAVLGTDGTGDYGINIETYGITRLAIATNASGGGVTVSNGTIAVNGAGAASSGASCGITVLENSVATGHATTNSGRTGWEFVAPATSSNTATLLPSGSSFTISTYGTNSFYAGPGTGAGYPTPVDASNNVGIGTNALASNNHVTDSTAVGDHALAAASGSGCIQNTAVGSSALATITGSSSSANVAVGYQAMQSTTTGAGNVAIGAQALLHSNGAQNVAIGQSALGTSTASANQVAVGALALTACTSGSNNTALGFNTLATCTTGSYNTAVGLAALHTVAGGNNNVAVGLNAGYFTTGGSDNVLIGYNAGTNYTASESNNICIGSSVQGTGAETNTIRIGNGISLTHTACYIGGITGTSVGATGNLVGITSGSQLGTSATDWTLSGNLIMANQGVIKLQGSSSTYVGLTAPSSIGTSYTLTMPAALPVTSTSSVLTTNTSGTLSWTDISATGNYFINGGNTVTATATLGTTSNYGLNIETNGTTRVTIDNAGNTKTSSTYKAAAYLNSAAQLITAATPTTVVFDAAPLNPNTNYSTTTGKFTVPTNAGGTYFVTAQVCTELGYPGTKTIAFYKNGSTALPGCSSTIVVPVLMTSTDFSNEVQMLNLTALVDLAAADTIEVKYTQPDYVAASGDALLVGSSNFNITFISMTPS